MSGQISSVHLPCQALCSGAETPQGAGHTQPQNQALSCLSTVWVTESEAPLTSLGPTTAGRRGTGKSPGPGVGQREPQEHLSRGTLGGGAGDIMSGVSSVTPKGCRLGRTTVSGIPNWAIRHRAPIFLPPPNSFLPTCPAPSLPAPPLLMTPPLLCLPHPTTCPDFLVEAMVYALPSSQLEKHFEK